MSTRNDNLPPPTQAPPTKPPAGPAPRRPSSKRPLLAHAMVAAAPVLVTVVVAALLVADTLAVRSGLALSILATVLVLSTPPFMATFAIESLRRHQSVARHVAVVMAPGLLTIFGYGAIVGSSSSTAAIGFIFMPVYVCIALAIAYGIVSLGEYVLRNQSVQVRWGTLIILMTVLGLACPLSIVVSQSFEKASRTQDVEVILSRTPSLEPLWSHERPTVDVSAYANGESAFVLGARGLVEQFTPDGEPRGMIERQAILLESNVDTIHAARFGESPVVLPWSDPWGRDIIAFNLDGEMRWQYTDAAGINDVAVHDLDDDGTDEVIVGYNGNGGVQALDDHGKNIWRNRSIGNVWTVDAADLDGDGRSEIVTTSAADAVHVFNSSGKMVRTLRPAPKATLVKVVHSGMESPPRFIVAGVRYGPGTFAACDQQGNVQWSVHIPAQRESGEFLAARAAHDPLLAIAAGPNVFVIDTSNGSFTGAASLSVNAQGVTWLERGDENQPILVVGTERELRAFALPQTGDGDTTSSVPADHPH